MSEMRQYSDYLIIMPESRNQWTYRFGATQVMQQFKFVLYPDGAARYINLLDGDIPRLD